MDDYIEYYYETAMEAEREYNDFIEAAVELYKELKEMDNIIWKNYRELLLWSRTLLSSAGKELWRKFERWNDEFRHDVYDLLKAKELGVVDTPYSWEILPFNPWLSNHEYNGSFEDLVHVLTQQSHGALFDDVDNIPDVHDYYEKGELVGLLTVYADDQDVEVTMLVHPNHRPVRELRVHCLLVLRGKQLLFIFDQLLFRQNIFF